MWERLPPGGHRQTLHSGRRPRLGRVGFGEQVESVGTSFGGCPKMSASWGVGRRSEAVQMPQEGGKVRWDRLLKRPPGGGSFHRRRGQLLQDLGLGESCSWHSTHALSPALGDILEFSLSKSRPVQLCLSSQPSWRSGPVWPCQNLQGWSSFHPPPRCYPKFSNYIPPIYKNPRHLPHDLVGEAQLLSLISLLPHSPLSPNPALPPFWLLGRSAGSCDTCHQRLILCPWKLC
jgi:hypothetical protein